MNKFNELLSLINQYPKKWLITGVAGFIGSNILELLLSNNQIVVGMDNLSTGLIKNLDDVKKSVSELQWSRFKFVESDVRNLQDCQLVCREVDIVLHHAALGSVQRSLDDPIATHEVNVSGFLNMLIASRDAKVSKFIYASSSSVYGDISSSPKFEDEIGNPLSPYAATKRVNEIYADIFNRSYGMSCIGLRYFNVFGKRQDPLGAYAAVMPKWISAMKHGSEVVINGDGENSRDFCYVENVLQANILAACQKSNGTFGHSKIFNVAVGGNTTLKELFSLFLSIFRKHGLVYSIDPKYGPPRIGDITHSKADITRIKNELSYVPTDNFRDDVEKTIIWYLQNEK